MNILSIQSHVTYGHVGNSAAVFPLQRMGHEVWAINTVEFSNHTGYGAWRGPLMPASDVTDIVTGLEEREVLGSVDAVLSGYQGGPDIADAILDAVSRVKKHNPNAIYVCDPVMGNAKSGCFVSDAIPPLLRDKVVPQADVIVPNQFELGYLVDREVSDLESTLAAVDAAFELGPSAALVTSVERPDREEGTVEMLAVDSAGAWLVTTPKLPIKINGSGDVTASLFTGHYTGSRDAAAALAKTTSSIFDLVEATYTAGTRELQLIETQDAFAHPRLQFEVRQVR